MGLYEDLAKAQQQEKFDDGAWFEPGHDGVVCVTEVINKAPKFIIIKFRVESTKSKTQPAGTEVKKMYSLAKFPFHMNMLKTDLVNIVDADDDMKPSELARLFEGCIDGGQLIGVLAKVRTKEVKREGKTDLIDVHFAHLGEGQGNSEEEIKKRADDALK